MFSWISVTNNLEAGAISKSSNDLSLVFGIFLFKAIERLNFSDSRIADINLYRFEAEKNQTTSQEKQKPSINHNILLFKYVLRNNFYYKIPKLYSKISINSRLIRNLLLSFITF